MYELFATISAAIFDCNQYKFMPEIVSKLFYPQSEVAVLFNWNLSRRPFLQVEQVVN